MCLFSGFYFLRFGGLCFYWVSAQGSSKEWEKKVNIGRPYKYLAYTYFVCVAFCFFLLVFSLGFMFAYLLSLGSSFVKRLADLGGHRCADFLGCLTIWGSFGGACQVFVSFVTVSKLACT